MKQTNSLQRLGLVLTACGLLMTQTASALITIDSVPVGNAGNVADPTTGYGAVGYDYRIGKYEVTLNQYTAFLNAVAKTDTYGLYNTQMGLNQNIRGISRSGTSGSYTYSVIGSGNRPVTYVSWYDSARFVNWLGNGQPVGLQAVGTTETGAYTLNGALSGFIMRNANATFSLPSENEWYKAAYHQPVGQGGDSDSYWLYPTANNAIPSSRNGSVSDVNSANFRFGGFAVTGLPSYSASQNYLTDAGAFSVADSYYGTFDQGGNVWEWNDAESGSLQGLGGGSWDWFEIWLRASYRNRDDPTIESSTVGFRVAIVPEPAVAGLMVLGMVLVAWKRK